MGGCWGGGLSSDYKDNLSPADLATTSCCLTGLLIECDASAITAVLFGTTTSSVEGHLNETCDITEAKDMLGSTGMAEISQYYEENKVSALGSIFLPRTAFSANLDVDLSSGVPKNEHCVPKTVHDCDNENLGSVAKISPPRLPVALLEV